MRLVGKGSQDRKSFHLENAYPVLTTAETFEVRVDGAAVPDATLKNDDASKTSSVEFTIPPAAKRRNPRGLSTQVSRLLRPARPSSAPLSASSRASSESFHNDDGQNMLAHAVYGFFNNGGSRCYVAREAEAEDIKTRSLVAFEAIDEIAIVAAPGVESVRNDLADHCKRLGDRFAILESKKGDPATGPVSSLPQNNSYAALYFPWIEVFDPTTGENILVPPSGHVAGIYARVDTQRGVHKAPANEVGVWARSGCSTT